MLLWPFILGPGPPLYNRQGILTRANVVYFSLAVIKTSTESFLGVLLGGFAC